jgi:hypothetical protein
MLHLDTTNQLNLSADAFLGQRVAVLGTSGMGKALALDTPLPTPSGWTTMGEVKIGDYLFDEHGCPCRVTFVTGIQLDRVCYSVTFSDGSAIIADADHLWLSNTYSSRRADSNRKRKGTRGLYQERPQCVRHCFPELLTTEQMRETLSFQGQRRNHAITCALPLELPEANLPIEPYTLGAWLGDGSSAAGCITTADDEVLEIIRSEGYYVATAYKGSQSGKSATYRIGKNANGIPLHRLLREHGLLRNKRIPEAYLRASIEQRLALLHGLMDTDGTINTGSNTCIFINKNKELVDGFAELIVSLGWIANRSEKPARLNGINHGIAYQVCFRPTEPPFRLSRKASKFNPNVQQVERYKNRYVVSIEPVTSVPVKCIQVDSPSHLYLAGRDMIPTHNTNTVAVLVEELKPHLPITIVDLESEYWSLKERFDFLVAGRGEHVDLELTEEQSPALAEFAMQNGVSIILDMLEYSNDDRDALLLGYFQRLWEMALKVRQPHMIVLEECHEFIPQGTRSPLKEVVTRIALRGRKRGLGIILASQRSAKVEKDVLTQANMLILHQVTFPTDIRVYQDILPQKPADTDTMIRGLGVGKAIISRHHQVQVVQMRLRQTTDVGATPDLAVSQQLRQVDQKMLDSLRGLLTADQPPKNDDVGHWKGEVADRDRQIEGLKLEIERLQKQLQMQELRPVLVEQPVATGQMPLMQVSELQAGKLIYSETTTKRLEVEHRSSRQMQVAMKRQTDAFSRLAGKIEGMKAGHRRVLAYGLEKPGEPITITNLSRRLDYAYDYLYQAFRKFYKLGLFRQVNSDIYICDARGFLVEEYPDLDAEDLVDKLLDISVE